MMHIHQDYNNLPMDAHGCVLAIGNFDGIHLGHQQVIRHALELARNTYTSLGVMTFSPHPRRFFQPQNEPFLITLPPMKHRLLEALKVDHLFALPFDQEFSQIDADSFIHTILIQKLKAKHIVVGADFAFGRGRSGTVETLKAAAAAGHFHLTIMPPVMNDDGQIYSSTAIRSLLRQGKFQETEQLLGRPWQMESPVIHGDKRGRTLNFPTANQNMLEYVRIPYGIYAVKVLIENETIWRNGAASFGIRPMFKTEQPIFETFIFDFSDEIYGKQMHVQPVKYLRPELSFDGLPALMAQMKEDCIAAKAVLESPQTS